ncbi:isochorismatase family cysteine hydrolase [Sporolactobacillus laevolacticus]|uniref:Isochorismatase n=1 Tax=Sporolactobacillus laevolacticus DSM 442 TaxID=1395513 RepID=V6IW55_9BACL|nr:isochorismatase family cysteine hydrolase [Sporolactobacillus laevolacticus]EST11462.1 isochorismatase [Sporolactobacillus laevolacticus DSM 442]
MYDRKKAGGNDQMRALLVIDVQQGFIDSRNFEKMIQNIHRLIINSQKNKEPIFFIRHLDKGKESMIQDGTPAGEICHQLAPYVSECIEKRLPSAFFRTSLDSKLRNAGVDEVILCGFNAEYCIFFNSVAAFEHGYGVHVIEDACASVNTGETYEMNDLDIPKFIFSVLDNSGEMTVSELDSFLEEYRSSSEQHS